MDPNWKVKYLVDYREDIVGFNFEYFLTKHTSKIKADVKTNESIKYLDVHSTGTSARHEVVSDIERVLVRRPGYRWGDGWQYSWRYSRARSQYCKCLVVESVHADEENNAVESDTDPEVQML